MIIWKIINYFQIIQLNIIKFNKSHINISRFKAIKANISVLADISIETEHIICISVSDFDGYFHVRKKETDSMFTWQGVALMNTLKKLWSK